MNTRVIFSHGKESGPDGSKIVALRKVAEGQGMATESIDYSDLMDADLRVQRLKDHVGAARPSAERLILVGSSMGAYVSLVAATALKAERVFLMAPALYIPDYAVQDYPTEGVKVSIVHGWSDDVVPVENSIRYARESHCDLHLVEADHRLSGMVGFLEGVFGGFVEAQS